MKILLPSFEVLTTFAILFVAYIFLRRRTKKDNKFPPGPTPYPIVGNLLQLARQPHDALRKWAKEYGPIIGLTVGFERVVFLTEPKLAKELFSDLRANGRPKNPIIDVYTEGNFGIAKSEGSVWNEQRRFTFRTLKTLAGSKLSMEYRILKEATTFLQYLDEMEGQLVQGKGLYNHAILNTLWSTVTGERSDPQTTQISKEAAEAANRTVSNGLLFVPALRHIAPELMGWNHLRKTAQILRNTIEATIERRTEAFKLSNKEPSDFISHYVVQMEKETDENSSFFKKTGRRNLSQVIGDLLFAGSDATAATLEYVTLYLSYYKEVQLKLHQEIDKVIGQSRLPSLSDRESMPYLEAIVLEVFRVSSFIPFGAAHRILEEMEFHGYTLPKGTIAAGDMYNFYKDRERWGDDADLFRPERHLTANEGKLSRREDLMEFSIGKRQCPGETLARDTLFLFITSIFQRFDVGVDPGCTQVDWGQQFGLLFKVKPFKIVFKLRKAVGNKDEKKEEQF